MKEQSTGDVQLDSALRAAGWSPGRSVSTRAAERRAAELGLPLSQAAKDFLRSYQDLELCCAAREGQTSTLSLDAVSAMNGVDPAWVHSYGRRVGAALSVVGTAASDHLLLIMDSEGALYAAFDSYLARVATTPREALGALLEGRPLEPLQG